MTAIQLPNFTDQERHFFCERLTQILYSKYIDPGDAVIDCGANLGLHTKVLSRIVGPAGIVHAFEPNPELFQGLLSVGANVRLWPFAVGDRLDVARLHVPIGLIGWASLQDIRPILQDREFKLFTTLQVDLDNLAELFHQPIKFIKIDVERNEIFALRGMIKVLNEYTPMLIFEGCSPDILHLLGSFGYEVINLLGVSLRAEDPNLPNVIAVHHSKMSEFNDRVRPTGTEISDLLDETRRLEQK